MRSVTWAHLEDPDIISNDELMSADIGMKKLHVKKLLNRSEFRAHCDRYKTTEAIVGNLV